MKELKSLLIESQSKDILYLMDDIKGWWDDMNDDKKAVEQFVNAYKDMWDYEDRKDMLGLLLKEVDNAYKNE